MMPVLEVPPVSIWGFLAGSSSTSLHCRMAVLGSSRIGRVAGEPVRLAARFSGTNGLVDSDARQVMYDDACQFWPNRKCQTAIAWWWQLPMASFFRPDSPRGLCDGEWRSLKLSAAGIPSDEINRMHYHTNSGRLWMATSGGGMASCKFGSDSSRSGPYFDDCENYRSSNTDFVVTNDVIDFEFLYEGSIS